MNNLKQIGLAVHNYHDNYKKFPSGHEGRAKNWMGPLPAPADIGTVVSDGSAGGPHYYWNWAIQILPYLEQAPLYKLYNNNYPNIHLANRPVVQTSVPIYNCPSDVNAGLLENPGSTAPFVSANFAYAHSSYRGMSGINDWYKGVNGGSPPDWAGYPNEVQYLITKVVPPGADGRGIFHGVDDWNPLQQERMTSITDGTSNTLMVGERATRTTTSRGTFWANSFNLYSLSSAGVESASLLADYNACTSLLGQQDPFGNTDAFPCKYGWGSFHDGGINFVCCDGHVVTISNSINMTVFQSLATIAGGEVVPGDF
jgi:hypothetical protein